MRRRAVTWAHGHLAAGNGSYAQNDRRLMTDADDRLDLGRIRDLRGRRAHSIVRRVLLAVLAVPVVLALGGAIGQPTRSEVTAASAASLRLEVPDVLRGGLLWRARIAIRATRAIAYPRVVLGAGFVEGMQLNTIEPSPVSEAGRGPRVVLSYSALKPGDELVVYLQLQVNPTTVGDQDTSVELDDQATPVARIAHTTRVLP